MQFAQKQRDRHRPGRQIRIRAALAKQLDILASRNETTVSYEVNRAIRELIERHNLWPTLERN